MSKRKISLVCIFLSCILLSCNQKKGVTEMNNKTLFGKLADSTEVYIYTLANNSGSQVKISEYGAVVVSLEVPDKNGNYSDVVLGYDELDGYVNDKSYFGAIVGRYGNRIGKGKFELDGQEFQLSVNDGENHLHGGIKGFNKVVWKGELFENKSGQALKLSYVSPDGEEGYPGMVNIHVVYTLTDSNELIIEYSAATDKPTIINPTHHSYFNLSGSFENTILDHELMIDAGRYTPVDNGLITTGELAQVENTPMDFRTPAKIGARINEDFEQLIFGKGYDHNWVLNNYNGSVNKVASLYEPQSGRFMEVLTDEPGIQFYSGNFLNGTVTGKNGVIYNYRTGLCLETQHYPDSPNKPDFPSVTLNPGEKYEQTTIYRFSVK